MPATILLSLIGLGFTVAGYSATEVIKPQKFEGAKECETGQIKVLYKETNKRLYIKYNEVVFSLIEKKATSESIRRFETSDGYLMYLHLPQKSMIFDNKNMRPILTECKDIK